MNTSSFSLAAATVAALLSAHHTAQCQVGTLTGSTSQIGAVGPFGLSIDGDTLVAAHAGPSFGDASGFYVFARSEGAWIEQAHFTETFPTLFARTVALGGDTVVVGDPPFVLDPTASAHVFTRSGTTWGETATLKPVAPPYDLTDFAASAAVSGDTIAIGEPMASFEDTPGRVYVFVESAGAWIHQATLTSGAGGTDQFGASVALDGDRLFVGAAWTGAVHEFRRTDGAWTEVARITPAGGAPLGRFGSVLALDGTSLAVGSGVLGNPSTTVGTAYVFTEVDGAWVQEAALQPPETMAGDSFASTLDLAGDRLVVGAPTALPYGFAGAAYSFERAGGVWTQRDRFYGDGVGSFGYFGISLALDATTGPAPVVAYAGFLGDAALCIFADDPGCPSAAFTAAPLSGPTPLQVAFQDLSTAATAWDWAFGDGDNSTLPNPEHVYTTYGDFSVSLTARNAVGSDRTIEPDLVHAYAGAQATVRLGSGVNPTCFENLGLPLVGGTWTARIDASALPSAVATFLAIYDEPHPGFASAFGEVLLQPGSQSYGIDSAPVVAGWGDHAISIPANPALAGVTVATQGALVDGGAVLCNAIDLVLGY